MIVDAMTLAEKWEGPPWFKWAWLGLAVVAGIFILTMLARRSRHK
ncbi:hypothetical protein [Streptomyces sp. CBG33]|nr:hypothetical protein [Streptomyces sp. CBG33]